MNVLFFFFLGGDGIMFWVLVRVVSVFDDFVLAVRLCSVWKSFRGTCFTSFRRSPSFVISMSVLFFFFLGGDGILFWVLVRVVSVFDDFVLAVRLCSFGSLAHKGEIVSMWLHFSD